MDDGFDATETVEAVEAIGVQITAAVAAGFFTYEDIFNAAGFELDEDVDPEVFDFKGALEGDLTTADKVSVFEAYRAAVDAAYADAIANYATEFAAAEAIVEAEDAANADDEDELEPIYVADSMVDLKDITNAGIIDLEEATRVAVIELIGDLRAAVDALETVEEKAAGEALKALEEKVEDYFVFDDDEITAIDEKYADLYTAAEKTALIADAQAKLDALDVDTMSEMEDVLKAMSFEYITANKDIEDKEDDEVYTLFLDAANALTGTEDLAILEAYVAELDVIAEEDRKIAVEKLEVLNALGKVVDVSKMKYDQVKNLNKAKLTLVSGRTVTVAFTWVVDEDDSTKYTATTGSDYSAPATLVVVKA
jgi:hypothetical protein